MKSKYIQIVSAIIFSILAFFLYALRRQNRIVRLHHYGEAMRNAVLN